MDYDRGDELEDLNKSCTSLNGNSVKRSIGAGLSSQSKGSKIMEENDVV